MNKKITAFLITLMLIFSIMIPTVFAAYEDVTLKEAEDNVCEIKMGEDGKLVKKLVSVDDPKKEVTLQVDVTNLKSKETSVEPSEIFLVIDNSKSMSENKLADGTTTRKQAVFAAAKSLVNSILTAQGTTKIGVVSFSTNAEIAKEGTLEDAKLVTTPISDKGTLATAIDSIETTGSRTDIDAGLQIAKSNFSTDTTLNKYLILLTDGVPNTAVGGPTMTYSGDVKTKTQATLASVKAAGINIVTVMTGVNSTYKPDADGTVSPTAAGKTYKDLAEEIFGTQAQPAYGKFYYVSDDNVTSTITTNVYSDVVKVVENKIKNITVVDYFPDDIIANYDFEITEAANIGNVTAKVNTENNSITWTIETLNPNETASFKYKLKLKENFDEKIIDKVMPTNKKVDVKYDGTDGEEKTVSSDVSPKIVLVGKKVVENTVNNTVDNTVAPTKIPQTGDITTYTLLAIMGTVIVSVILYLKKNKNI